MIARLRTPHVVLLGLGSAIVTAATACSSPEPGREVDATQTTQASSVIVDMRNATGTSLGTCSGTLISSKMVLTAGHCIAGASSWLVKSGSKTVKGTTGSTPWKAFGSDLSHPEHSDVGLILLESPIELDSYPAVATKPLKDGATAQRFRKGGLTTALLELGVGDGFRLNYLTDAQKGELVDPGAAVLDARGQIVGVVSGKGKTTNKLHIARVDPYAAWAKTAIECSSGTGGPDGLAVRTWGGGRGGTPNPGTWGSSSGGYGGGGGTSGGPGDRLLDGGATVPGSSGSPGGDTTASTSSSSSGGPGGDNGGNTCPGVPKCEGDCGKAGSGLNGGTGAPPGTGPGTTGSGEGCSGGGDNSETCPVAPDGPSCNGPNCGGCSGVANCQDSTVDYGSCASCSTAANGPIVK
jgi:hypothetical protein